MRVHPRMTVVDHLSRCLIGHASPQSIHIIIRFGYTPFHTIFVESCAGKLNRTVCSTLIVQLSTFDAMHGSPRQSVGDGGMRGERVSAEIAARRDASPHLVFGYAARADGWNAGGANRLGEPLRIRTNLAPRSPTDYFAKIASSDTAIFGNFESSSRSSVTQGTPNRSASAIYVASYAETR